VKASVANPNRELVLEETRTHFGERFGMAPEVIAIAPGRVNLIGEHTDYSSGFVLPAALPLYTCVAITAASGEKSTVVSTEFGEETVPVGEADAHEGFARYLLGALRETGLDCTPWQILVHGNIPVEAGLSSSASLLVATLAALRRVAPPHNGEDLVPSSHIRIDLALSARAVENNRVGVPCGIMDQFAVACGKANHAMLLDCETNRFKQVRAEVPGHAWLVIYSGIRRKLSGGDYGERVEAVKNALAQMSAADLNGPHLLRTHIPEQVGRLAKGAGVAPAQLHLLEHIAAENSRVHLMRYALEQTNAVMAAEILRLGHESLSQRFGVSLPEVDEFVAESYKLEGVDGLRLTGAGMGGSLVALVDNYNLEELMDSLETKARQIMHPEARVYEVPGFVDGVTWR